MSEKAKYKPGEPFATPEEAVQWMLQMKPWYGKAPGGNWHEPHIGAEPIRADGNDIFTYAPAIPIEDEQCDGQGRRNTRGHGLLEDCPGCPACMKDEPQGRVCAKCDVALNKAEAVSWLCEDCFANSQFDDEPQCSQCRGCGKAIIQGLCDECEDDTAKPPSDDGLLPEFPEEPEGWQGPWTPGMDFTFPKRSLEVEANALRAHCILLKAESNRFKEEVDVLLVKLSVLEIKYRPIMEVS